MIKEIKLKLDISWQTLNLTETHVKELFTRVRVRLQHCKPC